MSRIRARKVLIGVDNEGTGTYNTFAELQNANISIPNNFDDITSKASDGWNELLTSDPQKSVQITGDGIARTDDPVFEHVMSTAASNDAVLHLNFTAEDPEVVATGTFGLSTFDVSSGPRGVSTFSMTADSTGKVDVTFG